MLRLAADGAHWTISIEDDGSGIAQAPGDATRRGLGLEAMRIRAEEMGGSIVWESRPGQGTRVVLRFRSGRE
jgi:signal transduction histidine kinase